MHALAACLLAVLVAQTPAPPRGQGADALALQVALDRAGFSPGAIDGQMGGNTRRAADAYRKQHGTDVEPSAEPLIAYTITEADVSGPFAERIPTDMMQKAELPSLTYQSPLESLAERYHASPALIRRLNPQASFAAGEAIQVPNVDAFVVPAPRLEPAKGRQETGTSGRPSTAAEAKPLDKPNVVVTVTKSTSALTVQGPDKGVIFYAPVTTGSEHDPLPVGEWKVTGIQFSPSFQYNPDLFWDADPAHAKATLKPGPNNPVGVVWIDLSKEHYGIHGTPEPEAIGKTESHGCVRLTNWDALRLAGLVEPGTRVVFRR
jgi:lipoprotein-anchoring transpeptidase ErfK/SrfK